MLNIEDIKVIICEIIRTNELIVTTYDSKLLCEDYEKTIDELKKLVENKNKLIELLENSINEFFSINPVKIYKLKFNSFKLIPVLLNFEYIFSLPKSVNKSSHEYHCFISLMESLVKEYDSIKYEHGTYRLLDISSTLNLKDLLGDVNNDGC